MNHFRAPLSSLHDPLESDRVAFCKIGSLNENTVRILKVLLEGRRSAATE